MEKKEIKGRKLGGLLRRLKKGINIYTTKEQYKFDDSINSKVLCFAFGLVAEIERNLISMRTKEALAARKAEGKPLGRQKGEAPKMKILNDNHRQSPFNDSGWIFQ